MSLFDLTGTVAVVTGGNRGIGLGMARGVAKMGAAVAVWGRSTDYNAAAVEELRDLGAEALGVACDVTSEEQVEAATQATVERFGRIDSMFANAGIGRGALFPDLSLREWNITMKVNAGGTMLPVRAATEVMIEQGDGGSIVVTSSIAASRGVARLPHYAASKAAQLGLVTTLAVALAPHSHPRQRGQPGLDRHRDDRPRTATGRIQQVHKAAGPHGQMGNHRGVRGHRRLPGLRRLLFHNRRRDPHRRGLLGPGMKRPAPISLL